MSNFAQHYRELVLPQLHNLVKAEAACINAGVDTFTEAYGVVMRHAQQLGALFLPEDVLMDLGDWISDTLLVETMAADTDSNEP